MGSDSHNSSPGGSMVPHICHLCPYEGGCMMLVASSNGSQQRRCLHLPLLLFRMHLDLVFGSGLQLQSWARHHQAAPDAGDSLVSCVPLTLSKRQVSNPPSSIGVRSSHMEMLPAATIPQAASSTSSSPLCQDQDKCWELALEQVSTSK